MSPPSQPTSDERTTPLGLIRVALEYHAAGIVVDDHLGDDPGYEFSAPDSVNFLIGRSVELALKAFMLSKGVTIKELRGRALGHNLLACVCRAEAVGLGEVVVLSGEDRDILGVCNAVYSAKEFEYPVTGAATVPVFGPLQQTAGKILVSVVRYIPGADAFLERRKYGRIVLQHVSVP